MTVSNINPTSNYLPTILVDQKDRERVKELNESVNVVFDETMIVVGTLKIPDNGVEIVLDGELIVC